MKLYMRLEGYLTLNKKGIILNVFDGNSVKGKLTIKETQIEWTDKGKRIPAIIKWPEFIEKLRQ